MTMASLLNNHTNSRDNNFNLIRFIAATLVLFNHSYILAGIPGNEPLVKYGYSFGELSVDIFFITSGFLITSSIAKRRNLITFAWARALRIFPALIISILFCVLCIGPFFTKLPLFSYFNNKDFFSFIINNTTLLFWPLQYSLPGVFINNPYKITAVNGSIWTLPWEIKMYILLMTIELSTHITNNLKNKINRDVAILFISLVAMAIHSSNCLFSFIADLELKHAARFITFFFAGASLFVMKQHIILSTRFFLLLIAIIFIVKDNHKILLSIYSISIGYIIIYLAFIPSGIIRKFNSIGDYSYGIYVYAFPIQQTIVELFPNIKVFRLSAISYAFTIIFSILSWHLLEKKALCQKNKFIC